MARNRVIYQSQSVYCSQSAYNEDQTTSGDVLDLSRVQSCNYSFNVTRQDVNQFGELASIDRIITESPTVSFDTSYYLANFFNERRLGFYVTISGGNVFKSAITNIIDSTSTANQKNYYVLTTKEGKDSVADFTSGDYESMIGIGNGFLTSYSSEGSVGGLPTVSIGVEGQNMNFVNVPYTAPFVAGDTSPVSKQDKPMRASMVLLVFPENLPQSILQTERNLTNTQFFRYLNKILQELEPLLSQRLDPEI